MGDLIQIDFTEKKIIKKHNNKEAPTKPKSVVISNNDFNTLESILKDENFESVNPEVLKHLKHLMGKR